MADVQTPALPLQNSSIGDTSDNRELEIEFSWCASHTQVQTPIYLSFAHVVAISARDECMGREECKFCHRKSLDVGLIVLAMLDENPGDNGLAVLALFSCKSISSATGKV